MKKQLINLLKKLNPTEHHAYSQHIENKFTHITAQPKLQKQISATELINLAEIFGVNIFINTIFKNTQNFKFYDEKAIKFNSHQTAMGSVAIMEIVNDFDFNNFLTKVLRTSNAKANQGACLIFGKKINLIIISHKPYSNVSETFFNLDKKSWLNLSTQIRTEHECVHYCTKQLYNKAQNNLHDELIADFVAMSKTIGSFKADWFLNFISNKSSFKKCRFEIYVNGLPTKTQQALFLTAKICAKFIENWSRSKECAQKTTLEQIKFLCQLGISNMIELT